MQLICTPEMSREEAFQCTFYEAAHYDFGWTQFFQCPVETNLYLLVNKIMNMLS